MNHLRYLLATLGGLAGVLAAASVLNELRHLHPWEGDLGEDAAQPARHARLGYATDVGVSWRQREPTGTGFTAAEHGWLHSLGIES